MWQQRQYVSVYCWFQDRAALRNSSPCFEHSQPHSLKCIYFLIPVCCLMRSGPSKLWFTWDNQPELRYPQWTCQRTVTTAKIEFWEFPKVREFSGKVPKNRRLFQCKIDPVTSVKIVWSVLLSLFLLLVANIQIIHLCPRDSWLSRTFSFKKQTCY